MVPAEALFLSKTVSSLARTKQTARKSGEDSAGGTDMSNEFDKTEQLTGDDKEEGEGDGDELSALEEKTRKLTLIVTGFFLVTEEWLCNPQSMVVVKNKLLRGE